MENNFQNTDDLDQENNWVSEPKKKKGPCKKLFNELLSLKNKLSMMTFKKFPLMEIKKVKSKMLNTREEILSICPNFFKNKTKKGKMKNGSFGRSRNKRVLKSKNNNTKRPA